MQAKRSVTNVAAVGIIYPASDPSKLFIEVKDDGHPIKLVRRQLCHIGGNWIGDAAAKDKNTFDTFARELEEELSFDRPMRSSHEYFLLGVAGSETFMPTPISDVSPSAEDLTALRVLKLEIIGRARPFGDFANTVSKAALDSADPQNKRDGFTSLTSYYTIALGDKEWAALEDLQCRFGNLSNESVTCITSLGEILRAGTQGSFGHDHVLKRFLLEHGLVAAEYLPIVPGITSEYLGLPLPMYDDYLDKYEIARHP